MRVNYFNQVRTLVLFFYSDFMEDELMMLMGIRIDFMDLSSGEISG